MLKTKQIFYDLIELSKVRVVLLMLSTSWVGMFLASPSRDLSILLFATLGIGLNAACGGVLNQIFDLELDRKMQRTRNRPLPSGRLQVIHAKIFAFCLWFIGSCLLYFGVNSLALSLTWATLFGYSFIYTTILKHVTPQNIVIGGLFGATPPLLGWVAYEPVIHPMALLLVLIIYTWTPSHFWALAIAKRNDYESASIPMLPVTHGVDFTIISVVLYTILLVLVTFLPIICGYCGLVYFATTITLNIGFIYYCVRLVYYKTNSVSYELFTFSIWYLLFLFLGLVLDKLLLF